MTKQQTTEVKKKANEQDVDNVINWLVSEFENIDQNSITTKAERIVQAATRLVDLGLKPKGIAAELAKHAKELHVARSWIYEALPVEYKRAERSAAISKGRQEGMSTGGHQTSAEENGKDETKNDDQPYSEGETVEDIINKLRDTAQESGEYYIVPRVLLDKLFTRYAPKVAA